MPGKKESFVTLKSLRVGYNVRVHTLKYAQSLIRKWDKMELDGAVLHCQIELNPIQRSRSLAKLDDNTNPRERNNSRARLAEQNPSRRDPSISASDDHIAPRSFDDREEGRERRMMSSAFSTGRHPPTSTILKPSSKNEIEGKLFAGQRSPLDQA